MWREITEFFSLVEGGGVSREIVSYTVWAYHWFVLSAADVEDLLAKHAVIVRRETVRLWINRFGCHFAHCIRKTRPRSNDQLDMDEVAITIAGRKLWLWRVIDAENDVLDIVIQARCNTTGC